MEHRRLVGCVLDRKHDFDAPIQIAAHPVGTGQEDLFVSPVEKAINSRVFEEPIDDGDDFNRFAQPGNAGTKRADSSNVQPDSNAGA